MQYIGMNYINGDFCVTRVDFSDVNPCTEDSLGMFPQSTEAEVGEAITAAKSAFKKWNSLSRVQRADLFDKLAQLIKQDAANLQRIICEETGKNQNEAHAEVIEALHMCQTVAASGRNPCGDWMASELATKDAYVIRKPKGVVLVISPWNFPLAIGSFWLSGPTLLEGNCVVHKPSELTPMTAQAAAALYNAAGFPYGVYNLLHGDGSVGRKLVEHPGVDCILFTGSPQVGQYIRQECANSWHKTCACEMGGKSAVLLFEDGNQELALDVMVASSLKLSGQRCVSAGRLLIQRSIFEDFTERFVYRVSGLVPGDPFNYEDVDPPYYGPLISAKQLDRVMYYNMQTTRDPAVEVLLEGHRLNRSGYFLTPHVYRTEWHDAPFLKEEVFGPHIALIPFNDLDDAIRIYNDTEYGLACGVITDDFRKMRRCRDECKAGMIYLNGGSIAAESHMPFGGIGKSGNGYKSAAGTYKAVTEEVAVTVNYEVGKMTWAQGMKS